MEDCYERTPEDVRDVIKHAKLHESELTELTQTLRIAPETSAGDNLRFLQLDEHLLEELVNGGTVVFKGAKSENAVLCTSTRTYDVKDAETSNSLLLVPNLSWAKETKGEEDEDSVNISTGSEKTSPNTSLNTSDTVYTSPRRCESRNVLKVLYNYLELRPCKPKLKKLEEVLQRTAYSGPELEYTVNKPMLFTFANLQDIIQASDTELFQGLNELKAIEIDTYYRVLTFEYEFRVLSQMLDVIEENSWPLNRIDKKETLKALCEIVPLIILDNVFDFYASESDCVDGEQFYQYDEVKVCKAFARFILKDSGKFNYKEFLDVWKCAVPEGMTVNEEMLKGQTIIDLQSNPQMIWAFHESKLPENIIERFRILFQAKEKWTVDEIAPYIESFTTEKLNVNALLTKYARGSNQNNVRYYSAKHSK